MSENSNELEHFASKHGLKVADFVRKISVPAGLVIADPENLTAEEIQKINFFLQARFGSAPVAAVPKAPLIQKQIKSNQKAGPTVVVRVKRHIDLGAIEKKAEEARLALLQQAKPAEDLAVTPLTPLTEVAPLVEKTPIVVAKPEAVVHKPSETLTHRKSTLPVERKSKKEQEDERREQMLMHSRPGRKTHSTSIQQSFTKPVEQVVRDIRISETNTIQELAVKMALKPVAVFKVLMKLDDTATINQFLDRDTAAYLVGEFKHNAVFVSQDEMEESLDEFKKGPSNIKIKRPPVVTIMGHVDHGKTSLLDYIRRTRVTAGEAGGITQHIGAYHVETARGVITFLDTPGHETFSAMRARGAKITDIVVLVVAADDGVMKQTIEAIQHAQAAGVPIIVAVNKMDKPGADAEKIKQELVVHHVVAEAWGGEAMFVPVSAKTGQGIDDLLEHILLQAEVLNLVAEDDCPAQGVVIEARLDKGRGVIATLLVQAGHLKKGDIVLAGLEYGRVRAILNESRKEIREAGPSIPVEVLGLSGGPLAGDEFLVLPTEKKAREVALFRQSRSRLMSLAKQQASKSDNMFQRLEIGAQLNVIVKADVQGSTEALTDALRKLTVQKDGKDITVNVISSGVGGITESDVNFAVSSKAMIIGFNVRGEAKAREKIRTENVPIKYYSIIYEAIDELKRQLIGLAGPVQQENILGYAQVREVFRSAKLGSIAGCMVIDGVVVRNKKVRVLRDNVVIFQGNLESLRRAKEDVAEVKNGIECGIGIKDYNDIKAGDQVEVYEVIQVERKA